MTNERVLEQNSRLKSVRHFSADFKCSLKLSTAGSFNFRGRLISLRERAVNREFSQKTRIKFSGSIFDAEFECSLIFNNEESFSFRVVEKVVSQ